MKKETIDLLQEAAYEIKGLRMSNEFMKGRLDMFDKMMLLFDTQPNKPQQGMSPDLVYAIEKNIQTLKEEIAKEKV